jgi:hypothetical protein
LPESSLAAFFFDVLNGTMKKQAIGDRWWLYIYIIYTYIYIYICLIYVSIYIYMYLYISIYAEIYDDTWMLIPRYAIVKISPCFHPMCCSYQHDPQGGFDPYESDMGIARHCP